jgi:hypothetical protein
LSTLLSHARRSIDILLEWDELVLRDGKAKYPKGETQMAAYWQTLRAGYWPKGLTYQQVEENFRIWRNQYGAAHFLKGLSFSRHFNRREPGIVSLAMAIYAKFHYKGRQELFSALAESTIHRKLARTAKGYLCLVPSETLVGDSIVILKGGKLPLVLTSRGEPWELIGESCVHGIMYGEAFGEALCKEIRII